MLEWVVPAAVISADTLALPIPKWGRVVPLLITLITYFMAKGSLNAVMRGKKGNTVFYKVAGSNNNDKQGSREYVATVANPKTGTQALQRMKLAPAAAFYRAFKSEILDHSFAGISYGARSQAEFMKGALALTEGFPFVVKDSNVLIPGNYQMSRGSLAGLKFSFDDAAIICDSLALETPATDTMEAWVTSVLASAPWLNVGDQLTFAFIYSIGNAKPFAYVKRLILDNTITGLAIDYINAQGLTNTVDGVIGANMNLANAVLLGAAVIVSRPIISNKSNTVSWQRSNSAMQVSGTEAAQQILDNFFDYDAYQRAIASYMGTAVNPESDWYLNGGTTDTGTIIPVVPGNPNVDTAIISAHGDDVNWLQDDGTSSISYGDGDALTLVVRGIDIPNTEIVDTTNDTVIDLSELSTMQGNLFRCVVPATNNILGGKSIAVRNKITGDLISRSISISFTQG